MKRPHFPIISHKAIFLSLSGTLVVASIVAIAVFGFRPGIDFVGGTLWQVNIDDHSVVVSDMNAFFAGQKVVEDTQVYPGADQGTFLIKTKSITEDEHQMLEKALESRFGTIKELRFESIGPSVGAQLRNKAIRAAIFVLLAISLYIAFSFRKVSYPVKSWKYGIIVLMTLFHDVLIPSGMLAVLGHFQGLEMNTNFIVALLVIMGFSVHDTIVVFDRIRENLLIKKGSESFDETVNVSVNQTIARSVNTSLTLVLILAAMLAFGATPLRFFILTILVGTVVGTYSSIFVASPLLTISRRSGKNNR